MLAAGVVVAGFFMIDLAERRESQSGLLFNLTEPASVPAHLPVSVPLRERPAEDEG